MNTSGMPRLSQVEMRAGVRDGLQDLVQVVQPEDEAVVRPLVPRPAPALRALPRPRPGQRHVGEVAYLHSHSRGLLPQLLGEAGEVKLR